MPLDEVSLPRERDRSFSFGPSLSPPFSLSLPPPPPPSLFRSLSYLLGEARGVEDLLHEGERDLVEVALVVWSFFFFFSREKGELFFFSLRFSTDQPLLPPACSEALALQLASFRHLSVSSRSRARSLAPRLAPSPSRWRQRGLFSASAPGRRGHARARVSKFASGEIERASLEMRQTKKKKTGGSLSLSRRSISAVPLSSLLFLSLPSNSISRSVRRQHQTHRLANGVDHERLVDKVLLRREVARRPDEVRALAFQKARLEPGGDGGDVAAPGLAGRGRGELLRASGEAVIAPADVDACFFGLDLREKNREVLEKREVSDNSKKEEREKFGFCFAAHPHLPWEGALLHSDAHFLQPDGTRHSSS